LTAANLPERVSAEAVVDELLDRVCERGFVRFGDLRDAVARNGLKLPDLTGPGEWWRGDALLRADRKLAAELPGVYRPAEVYLRAVHRCTAASFGSPAGRWLCLWLVLPFGGGLMAVEFAKYLAIEFTHLTHWVRKLTGAEPPDHPPHATGFGPASAVAIGLIGVLILLLLHNPRFRRRFVAGLVVAADLLGTVLFRLPLLVWNSPAVRAVRDHPAVQAAWQRLGTAAGLAVVLAVVLLASGITGTRLVLLSGGLFLLVAVAVATPFGRRAEDDAYESASDAGRAVRRSILPGLVGWVVAAFREVSDRVERGLYAVDERLRFRPRDPRTTLILKAVGATLWFPLAYLLRFAFYLLVEPQANPVKHFPVVTVSHKLLLPAIPALSDLSGLSKATTAGVISLVPGVFGFLAWELKESWRLYAANRPPGLPPVPVGHHGETVFRLLVPGFHRGTVPKLFARLRRADTPARVAAAEAELHAVEHGASAFVQRHLVGYLRQSAAWAGLTPAAGPVRLGVRALAATVAVPELGNGLLRLTFADVSGVVEMRSEPADWQAKLTPAQADTLSAAVAGFARAAESPTGPSDADDWPAWVAFWTVHSPGGSSCSRS
jgi:hypothetical protein